MNSLTLNIAGIAYESLVDGPGFRTTVFFQGCPHHCLGCHNPSTWSFQGGRTVTLPELIRSLNLNPLIDGVTLSGGEPFEQAPTVARLAAFLKSYQLNIWIFTGYLWENLIQNEAPGYQQLLAAVDVLVDGPFIKEQADPDLIFKGSANQRIIRVPESLAAEQIIFWQP